MTSVVPMTEARVCAIIEAYGGDPRRWPAEERADAEALIAAAPARFANALASARALDAQLASERDVAPSEGAIVRASRAMIDAARSSKRATQRGAAFALAAAAVAGLGIGLLLPPAYDTDQASDSVIVADALGGAFEETP